MHLGGRNKWKDYVDLYFLLKDHFTIPQISERANELFGEGAFNSKLFRQQLYYFDDINYDEEVIYLPGFETSMEQIKSYLSDIALSEF